METLKGIVANVDWQVENTLILRIKLKKQLEFEPGQFINLTYHDVTRSYSVCNFEKGNILELLIKMKPGGKMSELLKEMKAGEEVSIQGLFNESDFSGKKLLCLAGGSGQAAFVSLVRAVENGTLKKDVVTIFSSRKLSEVGFLNEMQNLTKVKVIITLTRESNKEYENGRISREMVKRYVKPGDYKLLICGPEGFTKAMGELFKEFEPHLMSW